MLKLVECLEWWTYLKSDSLRHLKLTKKDKNASLRAQLHSIKRRFKSNDTLTFNHNAIILNFIPERESYY